MRLPVKAGIVLLAAAGVTTAVVVVTAQAAPSAVQGIVTQLVDGDTLDVAVDGRTVRIRMLDIDAPEITAPDAADQCLGREASAHLRSLVPAGTTVRLEFDREHPDSSVPTPAGVFAGDGTLVNAEMVRAGLAIPASMVEHERFHPPVLAARNEAAAGGRGLFSAEVACTLPGQVAAVAATVAGVPDPAAQLPGASAAELEGSLPPAMDALTAARALEDAFAAAPAGIAWQALAPDERGRLAEQVRSTRQSAQQRADALTAAAATARAEEDAAARAAAEQERQARAAEEERRARQAEERRQARLAEERRAAEAAEERQEAQAAEERRQPRSAADGQSEAEEAAEEARRGDSGAVDVGDAGSSG